MQVPLYYVYRYRDPRPDKDLTPIYVGKGTCRSRGFKYKRAFRKTKYTGNHGNSNPQLAAFLSKIQAMGLVVKIEIVRLFLSEERAFECERYLIKRYGRRDQKTGTLFNLTDGGEGFSWQNNPKAHEQQLALSRKRLSSPEHRAIIVASNRRRRGERRRPYPAGFGEKVSKALTGRKQPKEAIEKTRIKNLGKKRSKEFCERISKKLKGKKKSDAHRKACSVRMKALWADPEFRAERIAAITAPEAMAVGVAKRREVLKWRYKNDHEFIERMRAANARRRKPPE